MKSTLSLKFDRYGIEARLLPAILCSVPFLIFSYFYLNGASGGFLSWMYGVKWAANITFTMALLFLLVQVSRFISKELFERDIFEGRLNQPTTRILMHTDAHYSVSYTKQVHERIKSDFGIAIPIMPEEIYDDTTSRKMIWEAMSFIRNKVGSDDMVLQHNAEYGFVRNLIGGSVPALFMALFNAIFFSQVVLNNFAYKFSFAIALIYTIIILLHRSLITRYGYLYAGKLVEKYMTESV